MKDSGRQIGKKLFALLSPNQKKELAQFVRDYEAGIISADVVAVLQKGRFLAMDGDHFHHLTEPGRMIAEKSYERHRFLPIV